MALAILRALEEEGQRGRAPELLVKAPIEVANWLMNQKREHLMRIEARCDITVRIDVAEPMLRSRLRARWEGMGLTEAEIVAKLEENDLPNGRLVRDGSIMPDFLLTNT